jgi:hypothetical protein
MVAKLKLLKAAVLTATLSANSSFAAELYYYDGAVKRPLTVDSQLWAANQGDEPASKGAVTLRSSTASEKSVASAVSTEQQRATLRSTKGSPVFRSGTSGAAMALPGGVILTPKTDDPDMVDKLRAKGLIVERAIGGTGAYLVQSESGLSALELANRLHESGEYAHVSPNWWRERQKK